MIVTVHLPSTHTSQKWSQVQTPVKNLMSQIKDKTQYDTEYNVPSHQEVRTLKLTEEVELNYSHSPMNFTSRQHPQMNCSIVKSSIVSYCIFSKHSFHHSNLWNTIPYCTQDSRELHAHKSYLTDIFAIPSNNRYCAAA